MNENDSGSGRQSPAEDVPDLSTEAETSNSGVQPTTWQKLRWLLLRAAAVLGAFLLLLALVIGFAGWYTSRPAFCRSCHIMEPYYVSWQESSHRDVPCIKCHFPPGAGEKVRGKMLGLVQLAKYVTASEGPRPAAEIPDASCLRSGCHETRLLSGRVEFQGVTFDHRPHLQELRRGKKLRCTSCHSQIVQGKHMTVTTSTCFLCHFKDGFLNEGLGTCTRCHQIPDKAYNLGGGVMFDHDDLAYERGVDCANCHADLIRGNGNVARARCSDCHNREDDLARFGDTEFLHQMHVTDHKVDCLKCHDEIHHSLDQEKIAHAASDCTSCHDKQHDEQVNMLTGVGAKTVPPQPSSMIVARIACPTCHRDWKETKTGARIRVGSTEGCTQCHADSAAQKLRSHKMLRASLEDIKSCIDRVGGALDSADLDSDRSAQIEAELVDIKHDFEFLSQGNDIHNIHYADVMIRAIVEQLSALCRELKIEEPQVKLPEKAEPVQ